MGNSKIARENLAKQIKNGAVIYIVEELYTEIMTLGIRFDKIQIFII